jgi:hypothetical protein
MSRVERMIGRPSTLGGVQSGARAPSCRPEAAMPDRTYASISRSYVAIASAGAWAASVSLTLEINCWGRGRTPLTSEPGREGLIKAEHLDSIQG